jgi:penicillin-binding protein 2
MIVFDQLKKNDPHLRLLTLAVLAGMGALIAGLWWVQIVSYRTFSENQKAQSFRTVRIPAIRGKILDRNQVALAENQPSYNVILYIDELRPLFRAEFTRSRPVRFVTNAPAFWRRWMGVSPVEKQFVRMTRAQRNAFDWQCRYTVVSNIAQRVSQILGIPVPLEFTNLVSHYNSSLALPLPLLINLNGLQVARLLEQSGLPPGVDLEVQPIRSYPYGSAAAHILGYLRADNRSMEGEVADFNFRLPDYRGHTGLEHDYDQELRGKAGVKSVLVNSLGYRQSENVWNPAEPGRNLMLTLDLGIQQAAETNLQRAMPNARGAVVVMDPNNGDVLALASSPSFDPNWFIPNITHSTWRWMNDPFLKPQINRAIQEKYAPGSIFKILTGISALENGLDPHEKLSNPGYIRVPGRNSIINDLADPGEYDFRKAFIFSSNTYFISNGLRYGGIESLFRLGQRLHLGERTGILSRQETPGDFPTESRIRRGWVAPDTALLCMGQGQLTVTPLQMAVMVSAIANGGKVVWPRLTDRIVPADPSTDELTILFPTRPPRDHLPVSTRTLEITQDAMRADVEDGGTGKNAMVPGLQICGKTGTAQIMNTRNERVGNTVWFASYAPYEKPRWVVIVMIEGQLSDRLSGGGTCAPIAGKIYRAIQEIENRRAPAVAAHR